MSDTALEQNKVSSVQTDPELPEQELDEPFDSNTSSNGGYSTQTDPGLPEQELDEPFDSNTSSNGVSSTELETLEKDKDRKEKRYFSALWLIVGCLGFLAVIYVIEVFVSYKLNCEPSSYTSGIIEIIKTLLFTLSGYLFGKKEDSK